MKKIFIAVVCIMILLLWKTINNNFLESDNNTEKNEIYMNNTDMHIQNYLENVSMRVIEETITPSGLTIEITDKNKEKEFYDEWYRIDVKNEDGNWEEYPIKDWMYSNRRGGPIKPNSNVFSRNLSWKKYYGELPKGTYRVVRIVLGAEIYAEFTIE